MNNNIRSMILHNSILRELFFFLKGKKVNRKKIDKKIKQLSTKQINRKSVLKNVIVSLTTYGERLYELQYTLYSLVSQTVLPEKIVVNLAKQDFANISETLKSFEKYGVVFIETEDLRSYKKLIPTINMYPGKFIVTADDDIYYPSKWLETLWSGHLKDPDCIVCHLTKKIEYIDNKLLPYKYWNYNKSDTEPLFSNLILGGGGTVFPPTSFYKDVCKTELFMKLAPYADDIWIYFMVVLNGKKIKQLPKPYINVKYVNPYREYGLRKGETLAQINVGQDKNDSQFKAIMDYYKINENDFIVFIKNENVLNFKE